MKSLEEVLSSSKYQDHINTFSRITHRIKKKILFHFLIIKIIELGLVAIKKLTFLVEIVWKTFD